MAEPEQENELELQSFMELVNTKGRIARRRAVLATLVPIAVGAIVLAVIGIRIVQTAKELRDLTKQRDDSVGVVKSLTQEVESLNSNVSELKAERDSLVQQNGELKDELRQSMSYQQNIYTMNWAQI